MNKSDVIERVASTADVGKQQAERVIDAFFDTVRSAVGGGDKVGWPGFGSFSVSQRSARTGRNPQTGEPVKIAASRAVKFTAGSALKDFMRSTGGAKKSAASKQKATAATKGAGTKSTAPAKKAPAAKATSAKKTPAKKSAAATKKR